MTPNEELAREASLQLWGEKDGEPVWKTEDETRTIILSALNTATAEQAQRFHDEIVRRQEVQKSCEELNLKQQRRLEGEIAELRDALTPFAHDDLQEALGGNLQGDASPVYGRNKAVLTLGDFRRAKEALRQNDASHLPPNFTR